MRYYLIAGERSGDLHGGNLIQAIKEHDPEASFRFWGGESMQAAAGVAPVRHYRETAFMGVWEVIKNLGKIRRLLRECQQDLQAWQPDAVILIDYAGFNLRIAKFIKQQHLPTKVIYYISPKVWAWNTGRARTIRRVIDQMLVILPFEVDFYRQYDYHAVQYVGNPIMDEIEGFRPNEDFRASLALGEAPVIALLPGSRHQEVSKLLPQMLAVIPLFPRHRFVVAGVDSLPAELYAEVRLRGADLVFDQTYDLLHCAEAAVVASGTATLETGLLGVPQVVVYKTSTLTYALARMVIKIPYISLLNLVAGRALARELIQHECTPKHISAALRDITEGGKDRTEVLKALADLRLAVGGSGASQRAAAAIVSGMSAQSASV